MFSLSSFFFIHNRMLGIFKSVRVLFIALSLTAANSDEPVYRAVGDEVVFAPGPVPDPITIITWKHGQNIAVEWFKGSVESFRQFKERGDINGTTGALTITGLTLGDSGSYTAEINHKETRTTQLQVISRVSKPTVSTQWDPDNTYCVFTCESNTTNAGPVTYSWISQEKLLASTKEIRITKEESEEQFHCELKNHVSTEISESVQNPFTWKRSHTVIIVCCVLFVILSFVFIFFILRRKMQRRGWRPNSESTSSRSIPVIGCEYTQVERGPGSDGPGGSSHDLTPNGSAEHRPENGSVNHTPSSAVETDVSPDQVQTNTESTDTINETEFCGESNQELTADADPESSSQTDTRASPDQVLTDGTSEAEETSVVPSDSDSLSQDPPVQEQAADLPDET